MTIRNDVPEGSLDLNPHAVDISEAKCFAPVREQHDITDAVRDLARIIYADERAYRSLDDSDDYTFREALAVAKEELGDIT
jgi:hypothetical protein